MNKRYTFVVPLPLIVAAVGNILNSEYPMFPTVCPSASSTGVPVPIRSPTRPVDSSSLTEISEISYNVYFRFVNCLFNGCPSSPVSIVGTTLAVISAGFVPLFVRVNS